MNNRYAAVGVTTLLLWMAVDGAAEHFWPHDGPRMMATAAASFLMARVIASKFPVDQVLASGTVTFLGVFAGFGVPFIYGLDRSDRGLPLNLTMIHELMNLGMLAALCLGGITWVLTGAALRENGSSDDA